MGSGRRRTLRREGMGLDREQRGRFFGGGGFLQVVPSARVDIWPAAILVTSNQDEHRRPQGPAVGFLSVRDNRATGDSNHGTGLLASGILGAETNPMRGLGTT